jgi:glycosyltransferase involved in cell wall biosynthesis
VGALALAGYLMVERMAVRPEPIPLEELQWSGPRPRRVIVLPAYRAAKTLVEVVGDIPRGHADRILLVDDASADATVSVATALKLDVIRHAQNLGYGGNQKTCYRQALAMGADVVVMLHPDGQYDPAIIPNLCDVIETGEADIVLGSRWLGLDPAKAGMPWWKRFGNRFLTASENRVLGLNLSEYHTGYRAYSRRFLEAIPFLENSNDFVFDTQVLIQAATFGFKIGEVPAIGRYHEDASSVNLRTSTVYGLKTLAALLRYILHRAGFPCAWLRPRSDADKKALGVSKVAHHSHV